MSAKEYLIVADGNFGVLHYRNGDGSFKGGFVDSKTFVCKKPETAIKNLSCAGRSADNSDYKNLRIVERYGGRVVHADGTNYFTAGDKVFINKDNRKGVVISRKGDKNHKNNHLYAVTYKGGVFFTDNYNGELSFGFKSPYPRECDGFHTWVINSGNSDSLCFNHNENKRNTSVCKECVYN